MEKIAITHRYVIFLRWILQQSLDLAEISMRKILLEKFSQSTNFRSRESHLFQIFIGGIF